MKRKSKGGREVNMFAEVVEVGAIKVLISRVEKSGPTEEEKGNKKK